MRRSLILSVVGFCWIAGGGAHAEARRGAYTYSSAQQCIADSKMASEICVNAEANARAEFDEKAPRFPSRDACERMFGRGKCSLGFGGVNGGRARTSRVHFVPRLASFIIKVQSDRDIAVTPVITGLTVSARTALRRDTHINPEISNQARQATRPVPASAPVSGDTQKFGMQQPEGHAGPLPPRPSFDPNFDCAALLEPGANGAVDTGCYSATKRAR